jgi:hypothetical protein
MKPFACALLACCSPLLLAPMARAQNGLSDDRVSLPDGPGSIGGVGENTSVNANMGTASFSIPIRVPDGANADVTPELALSYGSGQGLGIAGIGWDLGSESIERTTAKGLPEYDTDDLFAADGSELVYVQDAASGAREYRARFEGSFARYRWHAAGAGDAGYWTAEYPDGSRAWYGADTNGTLVDSARVSDAGGETFRYMLVEMQDVVGRRVVHTYVKEDGWPRMSEVRYGYGGQSSARFLVRLVYEDRPDVVSNATPGHVIKLTKRLSDIEVVSGTAVIGSYALTYEAELDAGGMSRLQRVEEYGRDGGLLPIVHEFGYSRALGGECDVGCEQPFRVDMGTLPGGVNIGNGRAALIDINGDSLPDVVSSDEIGNHVFHISTLSSDGEPGFSGGGVSSTMGGTTLKFILGQPSVQLFDVNGDGFTDIVNQTTADALCNFGNGDWEVNGSATRRASTIRSACASSTTTTTSGWTCCAPTPPTAPTCTSIRAPAFRRWPSPPWVRSSTWSGSSCRT